MAIAFTNLGASANPDINSSTDATSYANTSWTPPTDGLIICFVIAKRAAALDTPTMSGNGLTWVQIGSTLNCAGNNHGLSLFAADATGSSAGATTIDFGGNTQLHCSASFFQATGVDLSGGVAAAFVQTVTDVGIDTTGTLTLAAASDSANRPIAGFFHAANEAVTPRANWTELDDLAGTSGSRNLETQYRDDAFETTASATWTTSENWGGIAAELKAEVEAVGSAVSPADAIHTFLGLPGLRGFWPLSSFNENGDALDLSRHAQTLTINGTPVFNINSLGTGYVEFDASEYFEIADAAHYDILGTESYVGSGKKGLTLGGWFYFPAFTGVRQLIYKSNYITNRSFELDNIVSGSAQIGFAISGDGTNVKRASMAGTLPPGQWHFLVGRFTPSTEVALFTNKVKAVNTSSIPASIFNSSAGFRIDGPAHAAMCFLCAEVISDALLDDLYDISLSLFDTGPDVADTVTLTEGIGAKLVSHIGRSEAVTLTEAKTVSVAAPAVSAGETITLTETVSRNLTSLVSQNETVTVSESSTAVLLVSLVGQGETVTLSEGAAVSTGLNVSAGETVTLTEVTLINAGSTDLLVSLAETITLAEGVSVALVTFATIVISDTLGLADVAGAPIFSVADALALSDSIISNNIEDTLTLTDTVTIGNVTVTVEDTLTFSEVLELDGPTVTPPAAPATGGLDTEGIVLRLLYGNDRRNPIRTLDIAQLAPGAIRLMSGGFAPGAGERTQLWSGESIRFDGQDLLAESRKNSQLSVTYALKTGAGSGQGSQAALSYFQRQVSRFFTEAKLHQVGANQNHTVWLEYRWPDGLTDLPTPTFGQLSTYYEVYSATAPKWPDSLHDDLMSLNQGLIAGVIMEITGSPAPIGLKQRAALAGGTITLHDKGVLIVSGTSSRLHWAGYANSGLTGNFTVTGWITLTSSWGSGTKYVFDYYSDASNRISLVYDATNTRWTLTKIVSGSTFTTNSDAYAVASGDDIHIQLVQDDVALRLYANGVEVASVEADNTMDDSGKIALGCPATGTIDGVDVILDGWRIMPDDITDTQALALYEAELPIKQDGGQVGPPPYWWTKDSDGQVDNVEDSTRDNWGIIGGVGGDLESKLEIQVISSAANTRYWLGVKVQDEKIHPAGYIYFESANETAEVTTSGGGYETETGTSVTFSNFNFSTDTEKIFNHYRMLARIGVTVGSTVTITPAYAFSPTGPYFSGKAVSYTGAGIGVFQLVDLGDLFVRDNTELFGTTPFFGPHLSLTGSLSFTARMDFITLLPAPFVKIETDGSTTGGNKLIIEDGQAWGLDASNGTFYSPFASLGEPLAAIPNKYNYLFLLQGTTAGAHLITHFANVAVYVTPRYLLPGGMVA